MASLARPVVVRFFVSHYCHKVDWALADHGFKVDQCRVDFRHLRDIRDINPENTVPVLELDDRLVLGSANILRWIDAQLPTAKLYPSKEVAKWEAWSDENIGPLARRDGYRTLYEAPTRYTRNPLVWAAARLGRKLLLSVLRSYKARRFYAEDDIQRPLIFNTIANQLRASDGAFLFGAKKTAADYSTAALLEPILRIRKPSQPHPDWDYLKAYVKRVKVRKSPYKRSFKLTPKIRTRLTAKHPSG